jgi:hypothetical protein
MNDSTGDSRAKRLAERLRELWEKPTTAECLRLSHAAMTEQPRAPQGARATAGPMVSTMELGIRIVAPRSFVVS